MSEGRQETLPCRSRPLPHRLEPTVQLHADARNRPGACVVNSRRGRSLRSTGRASADDGRSSQRRDCVCGGVGLLGRDAAVLEPEIGGVAGCVDPFEAAHLAVLIDGDEAVGRLGQAGQGWALELGERDHPIEVAAPVPRADLDHAASAHVEAGGSEHLDIAIGEQPGDGLAGAGAEDRKQASSGVTIAIAALCLRRTRARRSSARARTPATARPPAARRRMPAA